jgi:hypothetical protein
LSAFAPQSRPCAILSTCRYEQFVRKDIDTGLDTTTQLTDCTCAAHVCEGDVVVTAAEDPELPRGGCIEHSREEQCVLRSVHLVRCHRTCQL